MTSKKSWGLHWFRRDLRLSGVSALKENWKRHQGRVLGLFAFDSQFLARPDFSHSRFAFFLATLKQLQKELREQGGDLLVIDENSITALPRLVTYLREHHQTEPGLVSWSRDYEPYARARDAKVMAALNDMGVETFTARDHLLLEPHEVTKPGSANTGASSRDFYQVFTPFSRRWAEIYQTEKIQTRLLALANTEKYFSRLQSGTTEKIFSMTWAEFTSDKKFPWPSALREFEEKNNQHVQIPIPSAGFQSAFQNFLDFKKRVHKYTDLRDFPSVKANSGLSIYFKNGSLTVPQVLAHLQQEGLVKNLDLKSKDGLTVFVKEMIWREFYYSILWNKPAVETSSFIEKYRDIKWENSKSLFEKWCEGKTGFPIVDAGMRELNTTGFMHNRVRMIVASFLVKDLLIDWRWGENYFMQKLLDGDLAPNNGGWQWAASTGCDPQPYFRIFNPWLQSEKFDPDGEYIKKFVPELQNCPAEYLHDPEADRATYGYIKPVVSHADQKSKALALYK